MPPQTAFSCAGLSGRPALRQISAAARVRGLRGNFQPAYRSSPRQLVREEETREWASLGIRDVLFLAHCVSGVRRLTARVDRPLRGNGVRHGSYSNIL